MDLKDMEYFIAIADCGGFSEAARHLHMAQPPLSIRMKKLEEELGTPLFLRKNRRIYLTDAGSLFYRRASTILSLSRSTASEVNSVGKTNTLRIGITPTTMPVMIPYLQIIAKRQDIHFDIHDNNTYALLEQMQAGIIDCALIRTPATLTGVTSHTLSKEMMLAASSEPLPAEISMEVLSMKKLILYRRYEELILHTFHDLGLDPDIFCICDDARTALELAKVTDAVAMFPSSMQSLCNDIYLSTIPTDQLLTEIILVHPANGTSDAVNILLDILKESSH